MECDIENTKFVNIQMDHWKGENTNYLAIFVDFVKDMNIISYLLYIQQVDSASDMLVIVYTAHY